MEKGIALVNSEQVIFGRLAERLRAARIRNKKPRGLESRGFRFVHAWGVIG
jgi:hypothetical protein